MLCDGACQRNLVCTLKNWVGSFCEVSTIVCPRGQRGGSECAGVTVDTCDDMMQAPHKSHWKVVVRVVERSLLEELIGRERQRRYLCKVRLGVSMGV